jgi:protein ImuA
MEELKNAIQKKALFSRLKSEMMALQGCPVPAIGIKTAALGLGEVESAFAHGIFPRSGMQEFISRHTEQSAATSGFMAALAGRLMKEEGMCVWVSTKRMIFPLSLGYFGVSPDHVIFIDLKKEKDLLWVIEESLGCTALSVVVGEVRDLTLTESRRLQLVLEKSKITCLLHRISPRLSNPVSALCRWQVSHLPTGHELPGVGFPRWQINIDKIRNGLPGSWHLGWDGEQFVDVLPSVADTSIQISNAG